MKIRLMGYLSFLAFFLTSHVSFSVWILLRYLDEDNYSHCVMEIVVTIRLVSDFIGFSGLVRLLFMQADIRAMNRGT